MIAEESRERKGSDRRGQPLSSMRKINEWMQRYWKRYYQENPEKDRRSRGERRKHIM